MSNYERWARTGVFLLVSVVIEACGTNLQATNDSDAGTTPPATVSATPAAPTASTPEPVDASTDASTPMSRPAGNTGTGFFVVGNKLYDPLGKEFRIRGVNRNHWDSNSSAGLALSKANTERIVLSFTKPTAYNFGIVQNEMLAKNIVPIPGNWTGTCKPDLALLTSIVDTWVAQASTWTQLNTTGLINIANEWGPGDGTDWRDGNITAIGRMRAAGYTSTLVIDAGGCGQNADTVVKYGAAVLASDPQKNILFDVHVYGSFHDPATAAWMQDYTTAMNALKSSGLPILLGEFGPGRNIGPSPTMISPQQVIATAEASQFGWLAWSWDDNNLPSCKSDDNGFSMTRNCGAYQTLDDLTAFGKIVVPILQATAVPATNF